MTDLVEVLAWDTDFWGVRAARVHLTNSTQIAEARRQCDEQGIEWASLLVPSTEPHVIDAAIRDGYELVDVRYAMHATIPPGFACDDAKIAGPADIEALVTIARSSLRASRFFADQHLSNERCEVFYETWVRNSFNGQMADAVLLASSESGAQGFITVRLPPDGTASLPLVAVHPASHGKGVGRSLLASTLGWIAAHGVSQVEVVTQLTNVPAIRLYTSAGFRLSSSAMWLHRWFDTAIRA